MGVRRGPAATKKSRMTVKEWEQYVRHQVAKLPSARKCVPPELEIQRMIDEQRLEALSRGSQLTPDDEAQFREIAKRGVTVFG
jgi:hypothetical protein